MKPSASMAKKHDEKQKKSFHEAFTVLTKESVRPQPITEELSTSYLDYAMSVIVSRALPDARDGLKPVHRRILYAMWDNGLKSNARFKKSAFVVGEVLGKYHPHGDVAVYDALVRMAQDFSMRYPLIQGQGNFGSMDGDGPAAMRYTESKLAKIAEELLFDLEKQTVPFLPNYDGTQKEPHVLPAKLPNLLLNGTTGIAVGMATNVPPNNLTELVDAAIHLIEHPASDTKDLCGFVKGPDFPTGGIIYGRKSIEQAYATGYGPIVMRAKTEIEETKNGYEILVTEIPYQVNKSTLIQKMAELVKDKKIEGIKDIRDESNKEGVRIVIELKKDTYPKKVLNQLFQHTDLQTTFHVNLLALVDGLQPKVLNLKEALEEYVKHRNTVVRNRAQFDLTRAKERAHILEGLSLCLNTIDVVIKVIRGSKDRDGAKQELIKKFKLTEIQANAILDMKLANLAHLERLKIETELKEKRTVIKHLSELLKDNKKILTMIKTELQELKEKFGSPRRTQIVAGELGSFSQEDLIPDEAAVIALTKDGYMKRMSPEIFRTQGRGGKGVVGLAPKEEDMVDQIITSTTLTNLLFFTTRGRVFQLKAYEVPQLGRTARGQAVQNFLNLGPEEKVSTLISFAQPKELKYLVMVTKKGVIKKVALDAFQNVKRSGLIAIKLKGDDSLNWVKTSSGADEVMITTTGGQAIRFSEKDIRPMGRNASGVRGIRLKGKDTVVGMDVVSKAEQANAKWLVISSKGFGKLSPVKTYRVQGRGGSGIKTAKVTDKTGVVTQALKIDEKKLPEGTSGDLLIFSTKGQTIRIPLKSLSTQHRVTQGTRLMRFKDESDEVASITVV